MTVWRVSDFCRFLYSNLNETTLECRVHSVFNKAVNFSFNGEIITLLSTGRMLQPNSFILNEVLNFEDLELSANMVAGLNRNGLTVYDAGIRIDYAEARLTDLSIFINGPYIIPEDMEHRVKLLTLYLADNSKPNSICSLVTNREPNKYSKAIEPYIPELAYAFAVYNIELAEKISAKIAGCGVGLTPSSDDFLTGFLSAYAVISFVKERDSEKILAISRKAGYAAAARTTEISAQFLRQSGNVMTSQAVLKLLKALFSESYYDSLLSMACQIMSFGATSGADILTGILYCVKHFLSAEQEPCRCVDFQVICP